MLNFKKDLSVRAERAVLPALNDDAWNTLLHAEGDTDGWRIVEVSSRAGQPFDIELTWTAANGSGSSARVTVPHASRICVFARTVQVRAKNLSSEPNAIGVTVADGYAETRNQYEVRVSAVRAENSGDRSEPVRIRVPAFATTAWVESSDPASNGLVHAVDGTGRIRGTTPIARQPDGGIPVGGAGERRVWHGPIPFRVVFRLGI